MGDGTELIWWFSLSMNFSALKIPMRKVLNTSIHPTLHIYIYIYNFIYIYNLYQKDFLGNKAPFSSSL